MVETGRSTSSVLLQTAAPSYRERFYEEFQRLAPGLVIYAGDDHFDPTVRTAEGNRRLVEPVGNRFLLGRRLLWQRLDWRAMVRADFAILELNPRIVSTWLLLFVRRLLGKRTVLWGHASPRKGPTARTAWLRRPLWRLADAILVYTESEAAALRARSPKKEIVAAPNALYHRHEMGAEPASTPTDFVYVGRLVEAKRPELLVEAFLNALGDLPEWADLTIVGEGPLRYDLERRAAVTAAHGRVSFCGEITDLDRLREIYARAVASVAPGYVGLSIVQSLSFGVPMIVAEGEPHSPEIEAAVEDETALRFPAGSVDALAARLVEVAGSRDAWLERRAPIASWCAERYSIENMARRAAQVLGVTLATDSADPVPQWVRSRLACPGCLSSLVWLDGCCRCSECESEFVIKAGIPILLPHGEESSALAQHKAQQAHFFDHDADAEFEISRPHGTSRLYEWCIQRKFARSIDGLEKDLRPEAVALTVCGGSGMDAEFIASSGSSVICSDVSFEAARRAKERARRRGLPIYPIVADAERLPLSEESVDVAFVHDGLHHLEDPSTGLREMARVARVSVAVSEPSRALGTALAVRLRLAEEVEEAGNRVNRLTLVGVTRTLEELGFTTVASERYVLVYRHFPGKISKLLSRHGLFFFAKLVFRAADTMVGRWGNKLSVRATRAEAGGQ